MREHRKLIGLMAASSLAAAVGVGFNTRDRNVIENKGQALPKGAQKAIRGRRAAVQNRARRAANELVTVSNQTLVVAHLHPRWLRHDVEHLMNRGVVPTVAQVDAMRAEGRCGRTWWNLGNPEARV